MTELAAPSIVVSASRRATVTYAATDEASVVYRVRLRTPEGTWQPTTFTMDTSFVTPALAAGTWTVEVTAIDHGGQASDRRTISMVVPTDDRRLAFSSGMTRAGAAGDFGSTLTTTRRAGSTMTIHFTGTRFWLIGRTGPAFGRMRVVIDGHAVIVDEQLWNGQRTGTVHPRAVLLAQALSAGSHTVVITCLATAGRPVVNVDAFAWR